MWLRDKAIKFCLHHFTHIASFYLVLYSLPGVKSVDANKPKISLFQAHVRCQTFPPARLIN